MNLFHPRARFCFSFIAVVAFSNAVAHADFKGTDALATESSRWSTYNDGGGQLLNQNSRLEFVTSSPARENFSTHTWVANRGVTTKDWFIQVDTYLDSMSLPENGNVYMVLAAGHTESDGATALLGSAYGRDAGRPERGIVFGIGDDAFVRPTGSEKTTLRLHFNRNAKTLTASWKTGKAWKYSPPKSISQWGMGNEDSFTAVLLASSSSPNANQLKLESGNAYFTNFKAGAAKPDISVEHPVNNEFTPSNNKLNFGTSRVNRASVDKKFILRNVGTKNLSLSGVVIIGKNSADFSITSSIRGILAPGASSFITTSFKPKSSGVRTATLLVQSNDPTTPTVKVFLSGQGK